MLRRIVHLIKTDFAVLFGLCFGAGFFLIGGIVGMLLGGRIITWQDAGNWPTVEGVIVESKLQSRQSRTGRVYRPWFRYEYEFQGESYRSQGYDIIGTFSSNIGGAEDEIEARPVGSVVPLLVNPENPFEAVLIRGPAVELLLPLMPFGFALLGLLVLLGTFVRLVWLLQGQPHHGAWKPLLSGIQFAVAGKNPARIFIGVFLTICLGIVAIGIAAKSPIVVITGVVFMVGLWRAAQPPRKNKNPKRH